MHKVKSYDILWFCIKYTLFLNVLVPDKTSFLDHPLIVPLSDMPIISGKNDQRERDKCFWWGSNFDLLIGATFPTCKTFANRESRTFFKI